MALQTFNQWVAGSNPARLTTFRSKIKALRVEVVDDAKCELF
jgi:hypothetical protein